MATDAPSDSSTPPTAEQVAAAQAVLDANNAALALAAAAKIKPVTDFVASDVAKQARAALEALLPNFINDQAYGAHINCALIGLRGLGVQVPAAS